MNKKTILFRGLVSSLAVIFALLPVQIALCKTAESTIVTLPVDGAVKTGDTEKKNSVPPSKDATDSTDETVKAEEDDEESSLSTGMWVGIGVGAAVLAGVAIAAGGGGGSSDTAAPVVPPTMDQLVAAWSAAGHQPGSGLTYNGTYHLYQGGSLGYDLNVSNGQHLVGGGSWRVNGYQLQLHTDHGSLYSGSFTPGNLNVIHMNANTGWDLTLSR